MTRYIGWMATVMALTMMAVSSAQAKDKWHKVGEFEVNGANGREVNLTDDVSKVRINVTEGSIVINTLVVRQGDQAAHFAVGKRLEKDTNEDIDVGSKKGVTGFRISEDGKGKYRIYIEH